LIPLGCTGLGAEASDPEPAEPAEAIGHTATRNARLDGSLVPGYPDVVAEYLHIPGARTAGTPVVLDTGAFLRVRSALDGDHPRHAQAVVIAMPGFSSIPSHWLFLAAQLVHKANTRSCDVDRDEDADDRSSHRSGCRVEVWIVDRRG